MSAVFPLSESGIGENRLDTLLGQLGRLYRGCEAVSERGHLSLFTHFLCQVKAKRFVFENAAMRNMKSFGNAVVRQDSLEE